jgi:hypothetical protein
VEVDAGSWRPLDLGDIAQTIEHAALEVLSRPGLIQLEKHKKSDKPADYHLEIRGHVLDEAETHTVYLQLGPGAKTDLPSLTASHTVALTKKDRGKMVSEIEASSRKAAERLLESMKRPLAIAGRAREAEPPKDHPGDEEIALWQWAPVRIPKVDASRAAEELYSKKHDLRQAALRELTSLALSEASPRHVLERCVLEHPDRDVRVGCLVALRPLARKLDPTKRVVIQAFRQDKEDFVRRETEDQMVYFGGAAKAEAIQAFLESAANGSIPGALNGIGDVPNLDVAIRRCLKSKLGAYERPQMSCIALMDPLPHERRVAILWRFLKETNPDSPYYLKGAGEREGSIGTAWESGVKSILESAPAWIPELGDILWQRYQRTLSSSSLDMMCEWATPSKALVERMLEAVQTSGTNRALWGLQRAGEKDAKLRPMIVEKLSELLAMGTYPKTLSEHQLKNTIKEMQK